MGVQLHGAGGRHSNNVRPSRFLRFNRRPKTENLRLPVEDLFRTCPRIGKVCD